MNRLPKVYRWFDIFKSISRIHCMPRCMLVVLRANAWPDPFFAERLYLEIISARSESGYLQSLMNKRFASKGSGRARLCMLVWLCNLAVDIIRPTKLHALGVWHTCNDLQFTSTATRTDVYKSQWQPVKLWNTLRTEVINTRTINEFKNLLGNLWSVISMYTMLKFELCTVIIIIKLQ